MTPHPVRRAIPAWAAAAVCLAVAGAPAAQPDGIERALRGVYPALVRIYVVTTEPSAGRLRRLRAAGSGVIVRPDGYVVTNHHVAGKATRIVCRLADREELDAELVGTDPLADIAVLKLNLAHRSDGGKGRVPFARWGDSDTVRVGDVVYAMGCPAAVSQSVTKGIVSNTELIPPRSMAGAFRLDGENVGSVVRWIAHDAVIYGGNSGGPLVDARGRVIGINEIGLGSLGGAIPANLARSVAEQIIATGHVRRSWTGLQVQPRLKSGRAGRGVLVAGVVKDSPAAKAGLQAGDVITSFDGTAVDCAVPEQLPLFNQLVLGTPIGKEVAVGFLRAGQARTVRLRTVAREPAQPRPVELKQWGITARDISRMTALELRRPDCRGVLVDSVRPGGPCGEARPTVIAGDVIRKVAGRDVADVAALRKLTAELTAGKDQPTGVLVDYDRGTQRLLTVVKVGRERPAEKPARARKPWPAVATQVLTADLAEALGLKGRTGVRVTQVYPGRAGEKAGLKVGDIIIEVDGMDVEASQPSDADVFPTMIRQYDIGAEAELTVLRDGRRRKITMTLEAPPTPADRLPKYEDDDFELTVRELGAMDRFRRREDASLKGVLVVRAEPGGWAAFGGLAGGDVLLAIDGRPTPDVTAARKALAAAKAARPRRVVFFVKRGIHTMYVEIEPDWPAEQQQNPPAPQRETSPERSE